MSPKSFKNAPKKLSKIEPKKGREKRGLGEEKGSQKGAKRGHFWAKKGDKNEAEKREEKERIWGGFGRPRDPAFNPEQAAGRNARRPERYCVHWVRHWVSFSQKHVHVYLHTNV